MITLFFEQFKEKSIIIVNGNNVKFGKMNIGPFVTDIKGLKLDYDGVIKEHPDLMLNEDWEIIAKERFLDKIKNFRSEGEISNYIIQELKPHGFILKFKQRKGFRPIK